MRSLIQTGARRLSGWTTLPVNRQILSAAMGVGFASLIVKGVSFFKEIVVAFYFGTDISLDTFLIAFALPTFGIGVLGGAIQSAFTPTYLEVLHRDGREASKALLGSLSIVYAMLLVLLAILMLLFAQSLLRVIASGFSPAELVQTRHLFYVLVPILVFTGIARLYAALLAAEHSFTLPTLASVATPICTMAFLLIAYRTLGVYSLVIAATLGAVLELVVLGWLMVRMQVAPRFVWGGLTPELKQIFAQFFPLIAGTVLMAGTTITDQAMAAILPAGSVSSLNYGNKLPAVTIMLISGALGTAVLPYFSRMIAAKNWQDAHRTFSTFVRVVLFATVPLAILLIVFSHPIIRVVFQHGAFSPADTHIVSYVQMGLLLQIPFYIVGILAVRMIAALKKTIVLVWGAAISLV
ncbi:MAG: murein biosynthesis integral membrane protein MurJ, partial [Gammaproteobacteria bacterium]